MTASQVDLVDDHASCIKNNQHVIEKAARLLCPLSLLPCAMKEELFQPSIFSSLIQKAPRLQLGWKPTSFHALSHQIQKDEIRSWNIHISLQ
jgi:hypothetical protein